MPAVWICVALAAGAVAALIPPAPARLLSRRSIGSSASGATVRAPYQLIGPGSAPAVSVLSSARAVRAAATALAVAGIVVATARFGASAVGLAIVVAGVLLAARRYQLGRAAARIRVERRAAVRQACDVLASELRAGRTPDQALAAAAADLPLLRECSAVARMGGDVPGALRTASRRDGAEGLTRLAAAWSTAEGSGAGLVGVLDRLVEGLRQEEEMRAEVTAQLAAPRATARLLALLPLAGLALGSGIGSHPFRVLLGTPYGLGCLLLGGSLAALGVWWVERLARAVEEDP